MGCDRFCKLYQSYVVANGVTSRVERKAGSTIEVDWAGPTLEIVDPVTGESATAYLFVACLPFGRYAFVEPALDMGETTWLLPCGDVRVAGRLHAAAGARQPQDRRDRPSA